jgi:hypothetical protein
MAAERSGVEPNRTPRAGRDFGGRERADCSFRVETQYSQCDSCGKDDGGEEVFDVSVEPCVDSPPVRNSVERTFIDIALFVERLVIGVLDLVVFA